MNRNRVISTEAAPKAIGPYSQAIMEGSILFTSGQLPMDPKTGQVLKEDISECTKKVLQNIEAILNEAGYDMEDVVKTTLFVTDLSKFSVINEAYGTFFKSNPPARSCVEVSSLPKGAEIEIEAIAIKK